MNARPEPFDQATGEILPHTERAADGFMVPAASASAGSFLDLIEDGRFSAEAYAEIKDLGEYLMHRATVTEKTAKGKVTLTVEMEADGDSFKMVPKITVKKPRLPASVRPHGRTIAATSPGSRRTSARCSACAMSRTRPVPSVP